MDNRRQRFFDRPRNVHRILYLLYTCCAVLLLTDLLYQRHTQHGWDNWWGFFPAFGFVGCVLLVLIARLLRRILKRSEDYYDAGDAH